jgi:hypothetical protein
LSHNKLETRTAMAHILGIVATSLVAVDAREENKTLTALLEHLLAVTTCKEKTLEV